MLSTPSRLRAMGLGALLASSALAEPSKPPAPAPTPAPTPAAPLSPGDSLARKIEALRRPLAPNAKSPRQMELTEGELAAYLSVNLRGKLPEGLSDLNVRFDRDRLLGAATVDFELL